ncbi:MAG: inositol monophosphatase family protein [Balneolales bacterium]
MMSSTIDKIDGIHLSNLVRQVGEKVRLVLKEECQGIGEIFTKDSSILGDLVTQTDFAIQTRLKSVLTYLLPKSEFLGEEGFQPHETMTSKPHWIVDPLDGTVNFASGLPCFGASVALIVERRAVLGVVYDHGNDKLYCGCEGVLPTCNNNAFIWDSARAARAPIAISSGYLALMRKKPQIYAPDWIGSRFRIFGSQAVQLCWVAGGLLRLNLNPEAKIWDDAAGALICECAGAGYAAYKSHPLYPLTDGSRALAGEDIFSIAGDPSLVAQCLIDFIPSKSV